MYESAGRSSISVTRAPVLRTRHPPHTGATHNEVAAHRRAAQRPVRCRHPGGSERLRGCGVQPRGESGRIEPRGSRRGRAKMSEPTREMISTLVRTINVFGKGSLLRNEPQYPTKGYAPHSVFLNPVPCRPRFRPCLHEHERSLPPRSIVEGGARLPPVTTGALAHLLQRQSQYYGTADSASMFCVCRHPFRQRLVPLLRGR